MGLTVRSWQPSSEDACQSQHRGHSERQALLTHAPPPPLCPAHHPLINYTHIHHALRQCHCRVIESECRAEEDSVQCLRLLCGSHCRTLCLNLFSCDGH